LKFRVWHAAEFQVAGINAREAELPKRNHQDALAVAMGTIIS